MRDTRNPARPRLVIEPACLPSRPRPPSHEIFKFPQNSLNLSLEFVPPTPPSPHNPKERLRNCVFSFHDSIRSEPLPSRPSSSRSLEGKSECPIEIWKVISAVRLLRLPRCKWKKSSPLPPRSHRRRGGGRRKGDKAVPSFVRFVRVRLDI